PTTTVPPATTAAPTTTAPPPTTTTTVPALTASALSATLVGGELVLAGEIPSEDERSQIVEQFTQRFADSGVAIVDQLTIRDGLTLDNATVDLLGEVADEQTRTALTDAAIAAAGTKNMTVNDQLTIAENSSLLDELNALFADGDVLFGTASDELTPEATTVLDQAVDILNRDPALNVVVEGHTDSDGSERLNLDLSFRRADAVRTYLVDNGVAADRLTTVGRGESNPIADNSTPEGKRQNRRIEFVGSSA
ncbi:MAG: OmpA family protein, partial [Acidimicrobiales bacterium]